MIRDLLGILNKDWARLVSFSNLKLSSEFKLKYILNYKFLPVILIRTAFFTSGKFCSIPSKLCLFILHLFYNIEYTTKCAIGPGLVLPHPNSIIIGAYKIGNNTTIFNEVTIGAKYPDPDFIPDFRPILKDNCNIFCGARVLGSIVLSDRCSVGANSVVLKDCDIDSVYAGIPARKVNSKILL